MVADEVTEGLLRLGIVHERTLPYSPYQNGKQESFWATLEGRLMEMLDGFADLTLDFLNQATQAWVEIEYNRAVHREISSSPVQRFAQAADVLRSSPSTDALGDAFRLETKRRQRQSDGTISLNGVRFEIPARYRHFRDVVVGVLERPQSKSADFYRELGNVFAVKLSPSNHYGGFKALRERWKAHLASSRIKPVLLVDEAQEMASDVLNELRILSSADFDATSLLTVVFAGDGRLLELLRHEDRSPFPIYRRERNGPASIQPSAERATTMPGIDFNTLRDEITMEQVLELIHFAPSSRLGDQWRGPCPVHQSASSRSRSLSVNLSTRRYYCHKCQSKGNQLELWAQINQLPIYDAAINLCRALGRPVPWITRW